MKRLDDWMGNRTLTNDWIDAYRLNKAELSALADKLHTEQEEQERVVSAASARLATEKLHWFNGQHYKVLGVVSITEVF
jgi:hypothetical protein